MSDFELACEEVFRLRLPSTVTPVLDTPRRLIDYLAGQLPPLAEDYCLSQRVFYRLRTALIRHTACRRAAVRPSTSLARLIPLRGRELVWDAVRSDLGAVRSKYWPLLPDPGEFGSQRSPRLHRVHDIVQFLVARAPGVARAPDVGWTRAQIAAVIHALIRESFGLRCGEYTEDSRWTEDMGID